MRRRALMAACLALCLQHLQTTALPAVTLVQPRQSEVVTAKAVTVQIDIEGVAIPRDGAAEVWVNDVLAFMVRQTPFATAVPSFEPGFHYIEVALIDSAGHRVGINSTRTQFFYNPPPPPKRNSAGFLPTELGKVSVIIPSHDRYDSLLVALDSVRDQTYPDVEVIVVNDASADSRYYALIDDVMQIHLPYNIGRPGLVRNVGISAASGEWVAFLDDDDVWLPSKLEVQLKAMTSAGTNMSCSDAYAGNGTYVQGGDYQWWLRDLHGAYAVRKAMEARANFGDRFDASGAVAGGECNVEGDCLPDVWDVSVMMRANFAITTSVVVRREVLMRAGPFNDRTLGEDHDLWKDIVRATPCTFVRRPLVYWRVDGDDKLTQRWQE